VRRADNERLADYKEGHDVSQTVALAPREEIANVITHGVGFAASIVAGVVLLASAYQSASVLQLGACAVYAASLSAVYCFSTLSHWYQDDRRQRRFRALDQAAIYLLIVANFTPVAIAFLPVGWWWLLALMWGLALAGCLSKLLFQSRIYGVSLAAYLALGWMPVCSAPALLAVAPVEFFAWAAIGGLCYTVGTLFLHQDDKGPFFHTIWHLFVIAGSACHYVVILVYTLPRTATAGG